MILCHVAKCVTEAFQYHLCSTYSLEDCEGWSLSSCRSSGAAQARWCPGSDSWRLPAFSLFSILLHNIYIKILLFPVWTVGTLFRTVKRYLAHMGLNSFPFHSNRAGTMLTSSKVSHIVLSARKQESKTFEIIYYSLLIILLTHTKGTNHRYLHVHGLRCKF